MSERAIERTRLRDSDGARAHDDDDAKRSEWKARRANEQRGNKRVEDARASARSLAHADAQRRRTSKRASERRARAPERGDSGGGNREIANAARPLFWAASSRLANELSSCGRVRAMRRLARGRARARVCELQTDGAAALSNGGAIATSERVQIVTITQTTTHFVIRAAARDTFAIVVVGAAR